MITSNSGPMLGTLTSERWGRRHMRQDKPENADVQRIQVREAKRAERTEVAAAIAAAVAEQLADEREYAATHEGDDWWLAYATPVVSPFGRIAWTIGEAVDDGTDDAPDDGWCGCYCRRCTLHDDCGGCTENHPPLADDDLPASVAAVLVSAGAGWTCEPDELSDEDDAALWAEAHAVLAELNRDKRYDLDDDDLPGWGGAFDPADVQWGFTVTAVIRGHRAPTRRPHALDPESEF